MTIENREDYIKYRFYRAKESYEDALILAEKGKWNSTINRPYYACYYAVVSLLLKNNIETRSHDGARTQFGKHFVKNGLIEKKFGKFFTKLFDFRQRGDYGDLYDFDEDLVKPLILYTKEFIAEIGKYI